MKAASLRQAPRHSRPDNPPRPAYFPHWVSPIDPQAQRAELDALLIRQAAAAAERERQRRERGDELARCQLNCARQHLAACGCFVRRHRSLWWWLCCGCMQLFAVEQRSHAALPGGQPAASNPAPAPLLRLQGASRKPGADSCAPQAGCGRWRQPPSSKPPGAAGPAGSGLRPCCSAIASGGRCWPSCMLLWMPGR